MTELPTTPDSLTTLAKDLVRERAAAMTVLTRARDDVAALESSLAVRRTQLASAERVASDYDALTRELLDALRSGGADR